MTVRSELVLEPDQGNTLRVMDDTLRVLSRGQHTHAAYEMFELTGSVNSGPPPHAHPWSETYYILDGAVEVLLGEETVCAVPGSCVTIPGGTVHTYRILSETARFLVVASTMAASAFFEDVHHAMAQGDCSLDDVMAIAARHQVVLHDPTPVSK